MSQSRVSPKKSESSTSLVTEALAPNFREIPDTTSGIQMQHIINVSISVGQTEGRQSKIGSIQI